MSIIVRARVRSKHCVSVCCDSPHSSINADTQLPVLLLDTRSDEGKEKGKGCKVRVGSCRGRRKRKRTTTSPSRSFEAIAEAALAARYKPYMFLLLWMADTVILAEPRHELLQDYRSLHERRP